MVLALWNGEFKEQKDNQLHQEHCPHQLILQGHQSTPSQFEYEF